MNSFFSVLFAIPEEKGKVFLADNQNIYLKTIIDF